MSTELHVGGLITSIPGEIDLSGEFDRVRVTAADRPSVDTLPVVPDPAADHGQAELIYRREDIEQKHDRVRRFLDETGHDAVVLGRSDSVAWFTSGGELGQDFHVRVQLDPAVHQPDVPRGDHRQCSEQSRV